jgi:hypothetical protein
MNAQTYQQNVSFFFKERKTTQFQTINPCLATLIVFVTRKTNLGPTVYDIH